MSAITNALNGREPTGLTDDVMTRLSVYQQLDNERDNFMQVSMPSMSNIPVIVYACSTYHRVRVASFKTVRLGADVSP